MTGALSLFIISKHEIEKPFGGTETAYCLHEERVYGPGQTECPDGFHAANKGEGEGLVWIANLPTTVTTSLEEAREWIRRHQPHLVLMGRHPDDEPEIVEVWI